MNRIALIIGATGDLGSETARAILNDGFTVRALTRNLQRAKAEFAHLCHI